MFISLQQIAEVDPGQLRWNCPRARVGPQDHRPKDQPAGRGHFLAKPPEGARPQGIRAPRQGFALVLRAEPLRLSFKTRAGSLELPPLPLLVV